MANWRRPSKRVLTLLLVAAALTGVAAAVAGEYLIAPATDGPATSTAGQGPSQGPSDGGPGHHCHHGGGQHHPAFWLW